MGGSSAPGGEPLCTLACSVCLQPPKAFGAARRLPGSVPS
jgi:hypothetical protein